MAPAVLPAPSAAAAFAPGSRAVVLAFLPSGGGAQAHGRRSSEDDAAEAVLAAVPGMSVGIMSATQGSYSPTQLLLDITQGARVAASAYSSARPPALSLRAGVGAGEAVVDGVAAGASGSAGASGYAGAGGAVVDGWARARRRAHDAPQLLRPGLLASQIPGGAAYAGIAGGETLDGVAAADLHGRVAAVSLGSPASLPARVAALAAGKDLVVCDLPAGGAGATALRALGAARARGQLLIVLQRPPAGSRHELLWAGVAGLAGRGGAELRSQTTEQRGLIAAIDLAPTILRHLRLAIPADMRGQPVRNDGAALDSPALRGLMARLRVVGPRRLKALGCLLGAWALLLLACAWPPGERSAARRAWALRSGALGVLWAPVAVLIAAALAPGPALEYALIALACLALGALSDLLLPWPRAPLAPALVGVAALVADALAGSQLLLRSLLGPNPALGARFYGFGNELKSGLAVLVLAAVAAALYPAARARAGRAAAAMAGAGLALAAIEGSARIGAGVGGVVLVCAGTAVASVMLLPGAPTRRRALIVLISPLAGLIALAALDLATAHGGGHYTGSILHARSAGDLRDVLVRRYTAAWHELRNHAMPAATALALVAAGLGLRRRERLLAPVGGDPLWRAALAGGLAAGVVGALVEDSGPVLLVVAVFALICLLSYLWGRPRAPARPLLPAGAAGAADHDLVL